jgi:tetratricopeptide (TPR) repeat protein
MSDNYAEQTVPLFRMLQKEAFKVVIVFYNHQSLVDRLQAELRQRFPERKVSAIDCRKATYEAILPAYLKQESGFIFLQNFHDIVQLEHNSAGVETKEMAAENARRRGITVGLNLRRDHLAKYPIALFLLVGPSAEEFRARPLMEKMPDLWSFRSLILDLKLDTKENAVLANPLETSFRSIGNEINISTLGGNTEAEKREELTTLTQQLAATPEADKGLRLSLYEQMLILAKDLGEQELLQKLQQARNALAHPALETREMGLLKRFGEIERTELPPNEAVLKAKLAELAENEQQLLSIFAVLPNASIAFHRLADLLSGFEDLEATLLSLTQKGWLDYQAATTSFKVSPLVQQVTRKQNASRLFTDALPLIDALNEKLKYDAVHILGSSYEDAAAYARLGEAVVPCFPEPQNKIGILLERLGNFHRMLGDLQKALEYFEWDSKIMELLSSKFPDKNHFKHNLAASYEKLGDTHTALGDLDKALGYYEEDLRLTKELHEVDPTNVASKNGLAISYSKLGETHTALGDLGRALGYYEELLRLEKELHEVDPTNVTFKNGLAVSCSKLGDTHTALGDLGKALGYYEEDLRLTKELHEAYPTNVAFKNDLAISCSRLGETQTALGDVGKALGYYEEDLRLTKELHEAYPTNVEFKNGLAVSYWKLGGLARKQNEPDKAREYFMQAEQLLTELATAFPAYVEFGRNLGIVRNALEALEEQGQN